MIPEFDENADEIDGIPIALSLLGTTLIPEVKLPEDHPLAPCLRLLYGTRHWGILHTLCRHWQAVGRFGISAHTAPVVLTEYLIHGRVSRYMDDGKSKRFLGLEALDVRDLVSDSHRDRADPVSEAYREASMAIEIPHGHSIADRYEHRPLPSCTHNPHLPEFGNCSQSPSSSCCQSSMES